MNHLLKSHPSPRFKSLAALKKAIEQRGKDKLGREIWINTDTGKRAENPNKKKPGGKKRPSRASVSNAGNAPTSYNVVGEQPTTDGEGGSVSEGKKKPKAPRVPKKPKAKPAKDERVVAPDGSVRNAKYREFDAKLDYLDATLKGDPVAVHALADQQEEGLKIGYANEEAWPLRQMIEHWGEKGAARVVLREMVNRAAEDYFQMSPGRRARYMQIHLEAVGYEEFPLDDERGYRLGRMLQVRGWPIGWKGKKAAKSGDDAGYNQLYGREEAGDDHSPTYNLFRTAARCRHRPDDYNACFRPAGSVPIARRDPSRGGPASDSERAEGLSIHTCVTPSMALYPNVRRGIAGAVAAFAESVRPAVSSAEFVAEVLHHQPDADVGWVWSAVLGLEQAGYLTLRDARSLPRSMKVDPNTADMPWLGLDREDGVLWRRGDPMAIVFTGKPLPQ